MLLFGLLATVFSVAFLPICEQFVVSWLHRAEYVATELEVDYAHEVDEGADYVYGRVVADDTELRITPIPAELYESIVSAGAMQHDLPLDKIKGRRLPIWYAARAHGLLCDPRAEYRGEKKSFDTGRNTLIAVVIQVTTLVGGVLLTIKGWQRLRWVQGHGLEV